MCHSIKTPVEMFQPQPLHQDELNYLDLNNLIDINRLKSIALFLNVPGWKFVLCSIAFVAEFPLIQWHFRPGFISNVVPQNPDDVIVNKPIIEPVISNYMLGPPEKCWLIAQVIFSAAKSSLLLLFTR
jgi:hypothetical protein